MGCLLLLIFCFDWCANPMACAVECSTGFVKMTWQQALRSGTFSKEKPQRFSFPLWWRLASPTPKLLWIEHRQVPRTHSFSHQLPLDLAVLHWKTRQVITTEHAIIIVLDDITSSCRIAGTGLSRRDHFRCCIISAGACSC